MASMFYGCSSLITLNLSNFNTSNVDNMESMFHGCSALTDLDIRNFDITKVTNVKNMFSSMSNEVNLIVKDATVQNWVLNTEGNGKPAEWSTGNVQVVV